MFARELRRLTGSGRQPVQTAGMVDVTVTRRRIVLGRQRVGANMPGVEMRMVPTATANAVNQHRDKRDQAGDLAAHWAARPKHDRELTLSDDTRMVPISSYRVNAGFSLHNSVETRFFRASPGFGNVKPRDSNSPIGPNCASCIPAIAGLYRSTKLSRNVNSNRYARSDSHRTDLLLRERPGAIPREH